MDPFVLIDWASAQPTVSSPPIVGLAWTLEELEASTGDPEDIESDREIYGKGWRWCVCFSAREPVGEKGLHSV
jgi:hypothetical protein